jgi:hypothetical protein
LFQRILWLRCICQCLDLPWKLYPRKYGTDIFLAGLITIYIQYHFNFMKICFAGFFCYVLFIFLTLLDSTIDVLDSLLTFILLNIQPLNRNSFNIRFSQLLTLSSFYLNKNHTLVKKLFLKCFF